MGVMGNKKVNGSHYENCLTINGVNHKVADAIKSYVSAYNGKNGIKIGVERSNIGGSAHIYFKWNGPFPEKDFRKEIRSTGASIVGSP